MENQYAADILQSLRRIIRSIDQHNKSLSKEYKMTIPQLVCLRQLAKEGDLTTGNLAKMVFLSQATVTGILDRLEAKELITRRRSRTDRRRVFVALTERGGKLTEEMPWPLQERFARSLDLLTDQEQEQFDIMLKKLVEMMESPKIPIWPYGNHDAIVQDSFPEAVVSSDDAVPCAIEKTE